MKFVFQFNLFISFTSPQHFTTYLITQNIVIGNEMNPVSVFEGRRSIKNSPVVGELNKGPWDLQLMALRVKPPRPRSGVGPRQTEKWYSITWQRK